MAGLELLSVPSFRGKNESTRKSAIQLVTFLSCHTKHFAFWCLDKQTAVSQQLHVTGDIALKLNAKFFYFQCVRPHCIFKGGKEAEEIYNILPECVLKGICCRHLPHQSLFWRCDLCSSTEMVLSFGVYSSFYPERTDFSNWRKCIISHSLKRSYCMVTTTRIILTKLL